MDASELYPSQSLEIEWRTQGAVLFDARVYLSPDRALSDDDIKIVDEACGVEHNDHCAAARDVTFDCDYYSDNYFSCFEDDDLLGEEDLTQYFTELPFDNYLIFEVCSPENCEVRTHELTFL
ncbi:hypothetical protein QWI17_17445 [Gilvimarinus sp. SDUM040013]|uniref:Uncharacterized protein n=1 Tax=Gilvimarinus gilvus TaxID=3058038 RepID=A0ABU4RXM6_9GAMM|nr:hypothetical protein [Gilvimarinus sp. SDUM040013]MDO3387632.1 hypothetical protein [Gilvimarinus sp. SDUM040013]MDX6848927.1 hypothetical protein [Gilvimarinus sp. SDUM040013]